MRNRLALVSMAAVAALAGCAAPERTTTPAAPAPATPVPQAAAAQDCVELAQIRESRVIDDQTIDFIMRDGRVLRNSLPNRCPQLGFEKAFSYSTSLSRLCSVDIITVVIQGGGPVRGASCGLGKFVPQAPAATPPAS